MKKFLHKLTMGNCSQLLILEARGIMGAIETLGQIDDMDVIGIPRRWHRDGTSSLFPHHSPSSPGIQLGFNIKISQQKLIFI